MGIVESVLADFELSDGTQYTIEETQHTGIHIHIDNIRFDLSEKEFKYFVETVAEANRNLERIKNLE